MSPGALPLRKPFLWAALILGILAFGLEAGVSAGGIFGKQPGASVEIPQNPSVDELRGLTALKSVSSKSRAVGALGTFDLVLVMTLGLFAAPLVVPPGILGRVQGPIHLVTAVVIGSGALTILVKAFASLILMINLLLAFPFGTLAYLALYGFFAVSPPASILHGAFFLKAAAFVCLVAADELFLSNVGLVVLAICTLGLHIVLNFLLHFPPRFLVSITDAGGAILVSAIALLWALVMAFSGIVSIAKALKSAFHR